MRLFLLSLFCFSLLGCTLNPATGARQFTVFMSPEKAAEIGRKEHIKIVKQYGVYRHEKLTDLVNGIGVKLVQVGEREEMVWHFTILDTDMLNAFATPGGYLYVTRGLLAIAQSEAEVAAVLAHEMGHITARHSAQQYSHAKALDFGIKILGRVLTQVPTGTGQIVSLGTNLYLKKYSRTHEYQADYLGVRYLSGIGYDTDAMASFLERLHAHTDFQQDISGDSAESSFLNEYFTTHPSTADRVRKAREHGGNHPSTNYRGVQSYMQAIDGVVYGGNSDQGFLKGNVFIHPPLKLRFNIPDNFNLSNQETQVLIKDRNSDAAVIFDMETNRQSWSVRHYLSYVWQENERLSDIETLEVNGLKGATGSRKISVDGDDLTARFIAIAGEDDRFYRFTVLIPDHASDALIEELKYMTYSFRLLTHEEAAKHQPLHLQIYQVQDGDTIKDLAKRMRFDDFREKRFRVLNGLQPFDYLTPGQLVKIVTTN